jgi:ABC-type branched-subunit amino acid transport system substrate-binding protein
MSRMVLRHARQPISRIALLLVLGALLSACGSPSQAPAPRPITIGVIADLSQPPGSINGQALRGVLDPTIARINAGGGVDGRALKVIYADPRDDPAGAVAAARRLIRQDGAAILYGGTLNGECAAIEELVGWTGDAAYMMAGNCDDQALTASSCNSYSFRLAPSGRQLTDPLAGYIVPNIGRRWALVYPDYLPGWSQAQDWRESLTRAGGSVAVEVSLPVPLSAADDMHLLSTISADRSISGIVLAGSNDDQQRLRELLRQGGYSASYQVVMTDGRLTGDAETAASAGNLIGIDPEPGQQTSTTEPRSPSANEVDQLQMLLLRAAMAAARFSKRSDTNRLIAALEQTDSSGSPAVFDAADHQGRIAEAIVRYAGQTEEPLSVVAAGDLPPIGSCRVSSGGPH